MKKYEVYKDSGVEWIGEIPEHWSRLRIKNIVSIKVTDGPHETPEWKVEGIPFISAEAIRGNIIDLNYKRGNISKEQHDEYSKKSKVIIGDILFCKSGSTTGKSAMVLTDEDFGIWSPLAIIRADKNRINNVFLYQSIQSGWFRRQVETSWTFGTQPNIGMGALENLWVTMPPIKEQVTIARYLEHKTSKLDTLITKKEKLIELLQEERTAIINDAVTKGLDPNVRMKDSDIEWLGEIPQHWKIKKLKYVGQCQNGVSAGAEYFGSGFPFVSYGDVYKNTELPLSVSGLAKSTDDDRGNFSVMEGDIFFTRTSETIEEIGLASTCMKTIENAIFAGFLIRFRPFKGMLKKEFSKYYFRCQIQRLFFVKEMNLVTRASLSQELLKRLPVLLPSLEEQKKISDFLDRTLNKIDTTISKTQQEIELLKEYKTALISEVVSGKVDVRNETLNWK